jgi:hypothetical protein
MRGTLRSEDSRSLAALGTCSGHVGEDSGDPGDAVIITVRMDLHS